MSTQAEYLVTLRARARTSRAAAITLFCLECVGCERAAVRDCTDQACALWPWRPYQRREEG